MKRSFTPEGIAAVAEMIAHLEPEEAEKLLKQIEERDPVVAQKIRDGLFRFEDLIQYENLSLQNLIKAVSYETLILSMRTASPALIAHFAKSMSKKAGEQFYQDLMDQKPQPKSHVLKAQKEFIDQAKELEKEGKLIRGKDLS